MQTTVEPLEGNKVRLRVAVPAQEFEQAIDAAFRKLAGEVRIPGFRPGKAPRRLLEARFGVEAAREQALRDSLPEYYAEAVREHDVDVIALPEIEITGGEAEGDVEFDAVVEVRPTVRLTGYDSLHVELPYTQPGDDAVDAQIESLRQRYATLAETEHPLTDDAFATLDISGSIDGEAVGALTTTDFLYQVGSGIVVPELDGQLRGTRPGAILEFTAVLPEQFGQHAGAEASFRVVVKDAQQRVLPDVDDEWVAEISEFDTLDALRDDVRKRLDTLGRLQAQLALRDKVLEAAAALVPIEAPETLVDQEVQRRIEDLAHQLSHRGLTLEQYLAANGLQPQELLDQVREGAVKGVLADLAIRAVVAQEAIEATDDDLEQEVLRIADRAGEKPERVRRDLGKRGLLEAVRSDLARAKAIQFLVDHASAVDEQGEPVDLTLPEGEGGAGAADSTNDSTNDSPNDTESDTENPSDERPEA